jgi:hypothetical protein
MAAGQIGLYVIDAAGGAKEGKGKGKEDIAIFRR